MKKGHGLSKELVNCVINFYQSDEYLRICPGKKDFVSVKVSGLAMLRGEMSYVG